MIKRLYVHNFRCLENFELPISGLSSVLLVGGNGSGKSTIGRALEVLQNPDGHFNFPHLWPLQLPPLD